MFLLRTHYGCSRYWKWPQNLGGYSSGSAIGVSAGFAPISIGTETCGSLILPVNRAALYTMKPTIGLVFQHGIMPACDFYDPTDPITKTVLDFANAYQAIAESEPSFKAPETGYASVVTGEWGDVRIGALVLSNGRCQPLLLLGTKILSFSR